MTNEEAIKTLEANYPDACYEQLREAVDTAISALKAQQAAGDTISRDAALMACYNGWNKDYRKIAQDIKDLPPVQPERTGRWIPCSEKLPEENGQYLITVKYKHVKDYEDIYAEHGEWCDGKWDMFCFGHCGEVENIIAWMPLPEPYKEGGAV